MGKGKRPFCYHQNFVPKGLSALVLGLYTSIKTLKYIPGPGVRREFTGPLVLWLPFCLHFFCTHKSMVTSNFYNFKIITACFTINLYITISEWVVGVSGILIQITLLRIYL